MVDEIQKRLRMARPQCAALLLRRSTGAAMAIDRIDDRVPLCFCLGDMMASAFGSRSIGMRWIGFIGRV